MRRDEMINTIGSSYFTPNTETGEFSYPKAFKEAGLTFNPIKNDKDRKFEKLDLRFEKDGVTVLIETKQNFTQADEAQLSAYVEYEKELTHNKIVAILANTNNDDIKVWRGVVSDSDYLEKEVKLKSMDEYVDLYTPKINDKEKVMQNTYKLNKLLQKKGINPFLRSRFVSTCLLAIKNGLVYNTPDLSSAQITTGIKEILEKLLNNDIKKAEKLVSLNRSVLEHQKIRNLSISDYRIILDFIEKNILPFINDRSTSGQDLLNLFFIAFNKYVGRSNKNQAFTPDHITDFMSKICGVNKNSVVLDPCCGSGAFLVRAMTQALDDCSTKTEQDKVKKEQIFGIEFEEDIYGLVATNMLIHSDGNSNIIKGNCFDCKEWIQTARPNVILMNPPYNASTDNMQKPYIDTWGESSSDPSKGLYFVKYILDTLNEIHCSAKLAVLLPVACAIGTDNEIILNLKKEILKENTLDAVFTLPNEVFYPGASASVCCMVFKVGIKHTDISNPDTFFGYYKDDGFKKKKNLGRVEQIDITTGKSKWVEIEKKWIETYRNRKVLDGLSAVHKVTGDDEWLCEAYMKTDFTKLSEADFQQTLNNYLAYLVKEGKYPNLVYKDSTAPALNVKEWKEYRVGDLFPKVKLRHFQSIPETTGNIPFISSKSDNNGVAAMVDEEAIKGNCITVSTNGDCFDCFYQPEDIALSCDAEALYNSNINSYTAMFIITILTAEKYKWAYGRKPKNNKVYDTIIKLPVDSKGNPDWQFMENYIKSLPYGDRL